MSQLKGRPEKNSASERENSNQGHETENSPSARNKNKIMKRKTKLGSQLSEADKDRIMYVFLNV